MTTPAPNGVEFLKSGLGLPTNLKSTYFPPQTGASSSFKAGRFQDISSGLRGLLSQESPDSKIIMMANLIVGFYLCLTSLNKFN